MECLLNIQGFPVAQTLSCDRDQGCIGNATSTEELHSQEFNQEPDVRIDYHSSFLSHMNMRMVLRMIFSDWLEAAARKYPDGLPGHGSAERHILHVMVAGSAARSPGKFHALKSTRIYLVLIWEYETKGSGRPPHADAGRLENKSDTQ